MTVSQMDDRGSAGAIEATVRDYFEGWFDGAPERMEAALHPALVKRSLTDDGSEVEEPQSAAEMVSLTREGLGTRWRPEQRHFEIEIADVHGRIATVVVRSAIYREYLHLTHVDDGWKIVHALYAPAELAE